LLGIHVHKYGPHIFHTSNRLIWEYINKFAEFNNFINSPLAFSNGQIYNLPFNMNTFSKLWGVITPSEAHEKILKERVLIRNPKNLEEQAISLVGKTIYEKFIKEYSEKQWGRSCKELPAFLIKRLPIRYTYNNNYFDDLYQGIPIGGYNKIFEKLLDGIDVELNCSFLDDREKYSKLANRIIYTGTIDGFFDYKFGRLEYRSLRFNEKVFEIDNYQGNAVINYTSKEVPYTRLIEHKYFDYNNQKKTIISEEYPVCRMSNENEPFYPINDFANMHKLDKYLQLKEKSKNVIFGGRLAEYKYYDMDDIIYEVNKLIKKEF